MKFQILELIFETFLIIPSNSRMDYFFFFLNAMPQISLNCEGTDIEPHHLHEPDLDI